MQPSPPPPVANGTSGIAPAAAAASAPSGAAPPRLFFGSLEGALRAQGASAATASAANAAAAAVPVVPASKAPVSFNNRSALLNVATHANSDADAASAAAAKPLSDTVRAGMQSGNINISGMGADTFALSASTQAAKAAQDAYLREMEIAKKARSVVVPTSDNLVRKRLREMGEPITLFGERVRTQRTNKPRSLSLTHTPHRTALRNAPPSSNPCL